MSRISVIVPAYNRATLIGETLDCLLRQTLPPHELFVVDDGSTDDTATLVRGFGDRVQLIQQANAGPGAARNAALARATGDFVQFFDSDDLCTHDKFERQAHALAGSGADIAYSAWAQSWFEGDRVRIGNLLLQQAAVPLPELSAFLRGWVLFLPNCLIRRDLLVRVGGYPTATRTGEDLELLFRLILEGAKFVYAPGPVLLVRQHPQGQISAASDLAPTRVRDRMQLVERVRESLAASRTRVGWRDRLLWEAYAWESARLCAALDPEAPRVRARPHYAAVRRIRQVAAGLRARCGGSRLNSLFAAAPITSGQREDIRALGYEPVAA